MFLVFFFLLSIVVFGIVGQLHSLESGINLDFVSRGLDDAIPFVPEMVIFYLYLYTLMAASTMFYFALIEYKRGYALGWSLVFVAVIALVIYAILPVSVFDLHQDLLEHQLSGNFWASQVYFFTESVPTAFNSFPSLHAAISVTCFYTWYKYGKEKCSSWISGVTIVVFIIATGTVLSTLLIKQHYIADEIAGIGLGWGVSRLVYGRLWKPLKLAESPAGKKMEGLKT